ncbi:MAG: replication protein [Nitrospirae bacterium]|nr:replication protein [Nitrospirota bacterium]
MPTKQTKYFTMIPNRYLEALMKRDLNGYERRVLDCIIRKTYGYHTDKAQISDRDISRMTDIDRRNIQRTLKSLEEKGLICAYSLGQGKTKNYSLIDISKIESELIPTSFNATTGVELDATINKYIYKEITTGVELDATQPPPPPAPPQGKKAATKTEFIGPLPTVAGKSLSTVASEFDRWIASINERMQKHFDDREAE